jgi:hypothetical protein
MIEKKKFLLRVDGTLYSALEKWAADDLRSVNAQIEFLLTDLAKKGGRMPAKDQKPDRQTSPGSSVPLDIQS